MVTKILKTITFLVLVILFTTQAKAAVFQYFPETATALYAGDGSISRSGLNCLVVSGYANCHDNVAGDNTKNGTDSMTLQNDYVTSGTLSYTIARGFFSFPVSYPNATTSMIIPGSIIASTTFSFYDLSGSTATRGDGIAISSSSPADPAALVNGDFDAWADGGKSYFDSIDIWTDAVEILRPQSHTDDGNLTTSETNAYDASGNSTQSDTDLSADHTPSFRVYNMPNAGQTYANLVLAISYEHIGNGGDDEFQIQYSLNNTDGTCDSASWTTIVGFTAVDVADKTWSTTTLDTTQDTSDICVRINSNRNGGADSNNHFYLEDVYTYGTYGASTGNWTGSGRNYLNGSSGHNLYHTLNAERAWNYAVTTKTDADEDAPIDTETTAINIYASERRDDPAGTTEDPYILVNAYGGQDMMIGMSF